jgi:hypothetical protein
VLVSGSGPAFVAHLDQDELTYRLRAEHPEQAGPVGVAIDRYQFVPGSSLNEEQQIAGAADVDELQLRKVY